MNQIENIDRLIDFWQREVPAEEVDLRHYKDTCGGLYCIGGHMGKANLFGVVFREDSFPQLKTFDRTIYGEEIAEYLFGDMKLFERRGHHPIDHDHPEDSDYQLAVHRMHYAKDQLCRRSSDLYD